MTKEETKISELSELAIREIREQICKKLDLPVPTLEDDIKFLKNCVNNLQAENKAQKEQIEIKNAEIKKLQAENANLKYDTIDYQERWKEESEYSDTLSKELKKQKEILDVLKGYVGVDYDIDCPEPYRLYIGDDEIEISKERYELFKELLENDR